MNTLGLTGAVTAIANTIAERLTESELALASGLFVQLGDTLATIAAARALYEERASKSEE